ncbi:hypothetical protein DFH06DRAFT_1122015 [Mycena polygramma]|nr:hypothetical protein DFH06DRAFT_1122015 [Mycena polygramma]
MLRPRRKSGDIRRAREAEYGYEVLTRDRDVTVPAVKQEGTIPARWLLEPHFAKDEEEVGISNSIDIYVDGPGAFSQDVLLGVPHVDKAYTLGGTRGAQHFARTPPTWFGQREPDSARLDTVANQEKRRNQIRMRRCSCFEDLSLSSSGGSEHLTSGPESEGRSMLVVNPRAKRQRSHCPVGMRLSNRVGEMLSLGELFPQSKPSFIAYDDACSLLRHIVTQDSNNAWLSMTKFIVDAWHYIGHRATDILCRLWCNPAPLNGSQPDLVLVEEDADGTRAFNTETQLNSSSLGSMALNHSCARCPTVADVRFGPVFDEKIRTPNPTSGSVRATSTNPEPDLGPVHFWGSNMFEPKRNSHELKCRVCRSIEVAPALQLFMKRMGSVVILPVGPVRFREVRPNFKNPNPELDLGVRFVRVRFRFEIGSEPNTGNTNAERVVKRVQDKDLGLSDEFWQEATGD